MAVHLRYPTARETSAALLRVLAQGRPTIVSDLEHLSDLPHDAVVRADVADEEGEVTRALLRLAESPALRDAPRRVRPGARCVRATARLAAARRTPPRSSGRRAAVPNGARLARALAFASPLRTASKEGVQKPVGARTR